MNLGQLLCWIFGAVLLYFLFRVGGIIGLVLVILGIVIYYFATQDNFTQQLQP